MRIAIGMSLTMLLGCSAAIAETSPDAARATLAQGKIKLDLGDAAEAERLFGSVAHDPSVPEDLRCEGMVRQAGAVATAGDAARSGALYLGASKQCAAQLEAMRLLVEAVTGVQQDPATWRGRTEPVRVVLAGGKLLLFFGDSPMPTTEALPAGEQASLAGAKPISISLREARLPEALHLLSLLSGQDIRLDAPGMAERTVSLEFGDTPWDQVLALLVATQGLQSEQDARGIRVFPNEFSRATGDEALLQTVRFCMQIYQHEHGALPVSPEWRPVAEYAALVEPMYVRTLPRVNLVGAPILYRSPDGTSFELRMGDAPPPR